MSVRISADERISEADSEEVWLPGRRPGDPDEGPYQFEYPRLGKIMATGRRIASVDMSDVEAQGRAVLQEMQEQFRWLAKGFGPDAWAHIQRRLNDEGDEETGDPGDVLDDEHMILLFQKLNTKQTQRPTTSSNGASRQPWERPVTAAPSLPASASGS